MASNMAMVKSLTGSRGAGGARISTPNLASGSRRNGKLAVSGFASQPPSGLAPADHYPSGQLGMAHGWKPAGGRYSGPSIARRPASVMLYRRTSITLPSACTL
jgi:hypothetical protein